MAPTVGIVGGSISGNKGAEAMVSTVIGLLRRKLPDVRFVLFCPYYAADKPLEGRYPDTVVANGSPLALVTSTFPPVVLDKVLRWTRLRPARLCEPSRLLSRCDLLVDLAGISFADGRAIYLPFNVLTILPAMMLGVKVAKLSQAMGPFRSRCNRFLARRLLPRCAYLAARGAGTAENLREIGLDIPSAADVAFALNDLADMRSLPAELAGRLDFGDTSRPIVGISPSSVVYKNCRRIGLDYVGQTAEFARAAIDRGYRALLLPHSIRPNSAMLKNNDLPVVRMIAEAAGRREQLAAVTEDLDSISLRRLIGRCGLFLASRFHGMVAALATEVPVMVCGWGHKYFETLDLFGLRDCAMDYRDMTAQSLISAFDRLAGGQARVRAAIAQALPAVLAQARAQVDAVAGLLLGGA